MCLEKFGSLGVLIILIFSACGGTEPTKAPAEETSSTPVAAPPDLSQAGSVTGKVNFEGTVTRPKRILMGAEPLCEKKHTGPVFVGNVQVNGNGTLKNVFVWVKQGLENYSFETPEQPVVLNQDGCIYDPHVFGVQTSQPLKMLNSDAITHNIHPIPQLNREWNETQAPGQDKVKSFPRQEVMVSVKCNIHPWMKCYIGVVPHPYFYVTGDEGNFKLANLPPGKYIIEAWHEKFGTIEQEIMVGPMETKEVQFSFQG